MDRRGEGSPFLTSLGFGFLTLNSGLAIYRSRDDAAGVAFVSISYLLLILLFFCLKSFERVPADRSGRNSLKVVVWSLTTMLTVMFCYRVAAVMPLPMAALVCAMAAVGLVGVYKAFLAHHDIGAAAAVQNIDQLV